MERLKSNQNRSSIEANYHSIWKNFNKFLIKLEGNVKHLSWEERTVLFGTYLVEKGVQSQTIASYFSAIKHVLRTDNYQWDDNKTELSTITKSCRVLNDRLKVRLPIQIKLLELILFEVERTYCDKQPYLMKLYKTAFILGYYGMMRVGELTVNSQTNHTVKACDVHIGSNKDKILVILRSSKTHGKESYPHEIKISAIKQTGEKKIRFFCPFKVLREYNADRGNYLTDDEPFLIFRDRSGMKAVQFRETLKMMIEKLGLDPSLYNTHSLRSGRSNDMRKFGYSIPAIKRAGRWTSGAVFKYLRN